jgi:phosphopentomutase
MLYAIGPDFKKNIQISQSRSLIDIHATISEMMHLPNFSQGKVMSELFE